MQTEQAINSGKPHILKPRQALNKAFLMLQPNRSQIGQFKETYYESNHFINIIQINQLVYELNGLTEEEIEIVEGSVG